MVEMGTSMVPLIRFSGWLGIAVLIGNTIGSGILRNPVEVHWAFASHRAVFLNVHKIRVDSDNKR